MNKYHIAHIIPHHQIHGLKGYMEIIETLMWGLRQCGHEVSYALNKSSAHAINIVFGAQMLDLQILQRFDANTIIYNLEQIRGLDNIGPQLTYCAKHFTIWDYSAANIDRWKSEAVNALHLVPISYAPLLARIPKAVEQDIDVLLYGTPSGNRLVAFESLSLEGFVCLFVCGLYGNARDELIARSKIVLNINRYRPKVFEVVRVSYLLANKKAVLSDHTADTAIEDDIAGVVKTTSLSTIVDDCVQLLRDDVYRTSVEEAGFEVFQKRDICEALRAVL